MILSSVTSNIIQLLLVLLIPLIAVAVFVYLIFYYDGPSEQLEREVVATQFERHQASVEVYRRRLLDYAGVCDDIGLPPNVACQATETEYRLHQQLDNGLYYCLDSNNFKGVVLTQPRGLVCPE
jgi:hypothetical protein